MSKHRKINIRGLAENTDPLYRYTMEPIDIVNQRGKLVITNIRNIAQDLTAQNTISSDVKARMLVDFFKKRLSTSIKCNSDMTQVELKGTTQVELQEFVFEFIEYFVLCPTCDALSR